MDEIRQKLNQFVPKANILKTAGWILLFFLGIVATLVVIHGVTTQRLQIGMNWLIFISVLIGFVVIISLLSLLYFYLKQRSPNLNEKILTPESISNQKEREIYEIVQNLSQKAGLKKMPLIKIVYSDEINAMAMSISKNNSILYLYDGIIRTMDRESLEAVIAHEIGHIYNGDSVTSVFLYNFTKAIWILVAVVPYILLTINALTIKDRTARAIMLGLINVAFFIVSRIILFASSMAVNFHSRFREFKADKFASIVTSPEAMKRSLEKLKESLSLPVSDDYAILKINMPVVFDFFSTHPHLDRRIRAIEEFMAQPVARTSEEKKEQVRGYFILGTIMASVIALLLSFSSGGSTYDKSRYETKNPQTVNSESIQYSNFFTFSQWLKEKPVGYMDIWTPDSSTSESIIKSIVNFKITDRKSFSECFSDPYFREPDFLRGNFSGTQTEDAEIMIRLVTTGCQIEHHFETVYLIINKNGLKRVIIEPGYMNLSLAASIKTNTAKTKILLHENYGKMGYQDEKLKICEFNTISNKLDCSDLISKTVDNADFFNPVAEFSIFKVENSDMNNDGYLDLLVTLKGEMIRYEDDEKKKFIKLFEKEYRVEFLFNGQNYTISERTRQALSDWQRDMVKYYRIACEENKIIGNQNLNCEDFGKNEQYSSSSGGTNRELEKLRESLDTVEKEHSEVYRQLIARLPEPQKTQLKKEQINWINNKESHCKKISINEINHESSEMKRLNCLIQMAKERIEYLKRY